MDCNTFRLGCAVGLLKSYIQLRGNLLDSPDLIALNEIYDLLVSYSGKKIKTREQQKKEHT